MITSTLQDYIELIYNSIKENKTIRAIDIANEFQISRASVSEALIRLTDLDLIIYEGRKGIKITPQGELEAKKIIKKHKILSDFFEKVLNIDYQTAAKNACKIEHVIDEALIDKINLLTKYSIKNSINEKFESTGEQ